MPKAITIEQRQQMVKLAQDHYSGPEIARKMGCSTTTVYMILNQYADEHHISRQSLRVQEHRPHVFDDPIHKTWPLGSHQNIAPSNNTSPEEKVPEASVEDTAVTTVEEIPTEEIPEVGVEDTAVTTVEESPKEEAPEAGVEDTAVTTVEESPKEEAPEAGVEDTAVTTVEESPKEKVPEASVEDTAVTTVEESPKEEAPEASVEDTVVVADSKDAKHDPCKDDIDKLIDKILEMLAKNNEIIERLQLMEGFSYESKIT